MRAVIPDPQSKAFYVLDPEHPRCPLCSPAQARLEAARQFLSLSQAKAANLPRILQVISQEVSAEHLLSDVTFVEWHHAPWEDAPGWHVRDTCPEFGPSPFNRSILEEPIYLRKSKRSMRLEDPDRLIEGLNILLKRILNALPFHGQADSQGIPASRLRQLSVEGARAARMAVQWLYDGPREVWEVVREHHQPCALHLAEFMEHWLWVPAEKGCPRKPKEFRWGTLDNLDFEQIGRGGRSRAQAEKLRDASNGERKPFRRFGRPNPGS